GAFVVAIVTVAIVTIPNRQFLESCCASSMEQQRRILRASNIGQETKTFLTELIHIDTHTLSLSLFLCFSLSHTHRHTHTHTHTHILGTTAFSSMTNHKDPHCHGQVQLMSD